ncbi:MAG: outer membrane beta-barrel protein [Alphaproteobacteria bacterium]|nr:outer membrane beta-barrel protein [Alphaproteobacteria bacterium]
MVSPLDHVQDWINGSRLLAAAVLVCALPAGASASEPGAADVTSPWYVVGQVEYHPSNRIDVGARDDGLQIDDLMSRRLAVDFNFGGQGRGNVLSITEGGRIGAPSPGRETGGYEVMFSGSYDVRTGTAITPRISAGIGMASRHDSGAGVPSADPSHADDVVPALELGLGADYAVSETWGFSAEYRAFYHGAPNTETGPIDPQVSQQFTIGAKIRF